MEAKSRDGRGATRPGDRRRTTTARIRRPRQAPGERGGAADRARMIAFRNGDARSQAVW